MEAYDARDALVQLLDAHVPVGMSGVDGIETIMTFFHLGLRDYLMETIVTSASIDCDSLDARGTLMERLGCPYERQEIEDGGPDE